MVKNTGEKNGARAIRALNEPGLVDVREGKENRPVAVRIDKTWMSVASIQDMWRIDDEWWRPESISRLYFILSLKEGITTIVFKDLLSEKWFRQAG
ncbi:MAG: hypothetical protein EXR59_05330 [Dehalococcoidia bacterium]|nr:hypothetical protein [Dehalococcoidia bacterium]